MRKSAPCWSIRCSFSRSNCATRTASPISRATASVNAISSSPHRPGVVAVEGEHADQLVEDHDRNGENGARAETHQRVASSKRGIVQLRRGLDILDRQGLAALYREIRNRKTPPGSDRFQSTLLPLRRGDIAVRAQADQAAVDRQRTTGLLHGDPQQLVDVELRTNACRDPGDEAFSLERLRETGCRPEIVALVDGAFMSTRGLERGMRARRPRPRGRA